MQPLTNVPLFTSIDDTSVWIADGLEVQEAGEGKPAWPHNSEYCRLTSRESFLTPRSLASTISLSVPQMNEKHVSKSVIRLQNGKICVHPELIRLLWNATESYRGRGSVLNPTGQLTALPRLPSWSWGASPISPDLPAGREGLPISPQTSQLVVRGFPNYSIP